VGRLRRGKRGACRHGSLGVRAIEGGVAAWTLDLLFSPCPLGGDFGYPDLIPSTAEPVLELSCGVLRKKTCGVLRLYSWVWFEPTQATP
jgi:hypothetical protein